MCCQMICIIIIRVIYCISIVVGDILSNGLMHQGHDHHGCHRLLTVFNITIAKIHTSNV